MIAEDLTMAKPVTPIGTVKVLHDYIDPENQENKVVAGDVCNLLDKNSAEWWYVAKIGSGQIPSKPLYVPAKFVRIENKVPPKCAPKPLRKPPKENYMNVVLSHVKDADDNASDNKRNSVRDLATTFEIKQQTTDKSNTLHPPSALSKAASTEKLASEPEDLKASNSVDEKEKSVSNNEEHVINSQDVESQADSGIDNHEGHIDESSLMSSSGDSLDLLEDGKNTASIDNLIPAPDYDDDDDDNKEDEEEEVTYANVDTEANNKSDDLPDYANLEDIRNSKLENTPVPDAQATALETYDDNWERHKDEEGRDYYFNRVTKLSSWKPPRGTDKRQESITDESQKSSQSDNRTSTYSSGSLPRGWLEEITDDGEVFYINEATNEKWLSNVDESGKKYFYNQQSSVSSWELPEHVGPETVTEEDFSTEGAQAAQRENSGKETEEHNIAEPTALNPKSALKTKPSLSRTLSHPDSLTPKRSVSPLMSQRASMLLQSVVGAKDWDHFLRNSFANLGLTEKAGVVYKGKISDKGKELKVKSWEKCYLMTKGQYLCVFKKISNKSTYSEDKADQKIDLKGASITFFAKSDKHKKASILVKGDVDFIFYCEETSGALHEWNCALKNNVEYFGSNPAGNQETDVKGSSSDSVGEQVSAKKRWRFLEPFFKTRPTVESIRKKGIYKDNVFGSTLQEISEREKSTIPNFVKKCIQEIERKGLSSDGLYRVPGNVGLVQSIRCEVDQNEKFNLNHPDWDINALAGALKLFFRELREPLFPHNLYDQFLNAIKCEKRNDRIDSLRKVSKSLPKVNRETLRMLLEHLLRVEQHKSENRMEFHNIAIVFGPTLMQPATFGMDLATSLVLQNQIVELMLIEYKNIF